MSLRLHALFDEVGKTALQLFGAPVESIIEARLQDTLSGSLHVQITNGPDMQGVVHIDFPNFGQHIAPSIRILDKDNKESVTNFVFDPNQSDMHKMVYITAQEYAKVNGMQMADAEHVGVPEIPEPIAAEPTAATRQGMSLFRK